MQIKPDSPLLAAVARLAQQNVAPARPAGDPATARQAARAFFAVAQQTPPTQVSTAPPDQGRFVPRGSRVNIIV